MAYIGNNLTVQQYAPTITYFSGNASTTAFTLPYAVVSAAQIIVTVENVIQNPSSAFTVSGTTLTFTSAPPTGTNNIWVEYTSLQTTANALPAYPSVIGDLVTSGGQYAKGAFSTAYTDGIVTDYTTGTGRITVGASDGFKIRNNGTTSPVDLMSIDSTGNVGIGTASPATKLDVSNSNGRNARIGGLQIGGTSSTADAGNNNISSGAYWNGTNYTATATTAVTTQLGNGALIYYTDSGLTAGNTFTASERMRITPNGGISFGSTGTAYGTSGQVLQSNGDAPPTWVAAAGGFAAGTLMLFQQTAAPTGWTKQTTHDNKALRVVSGTAGSGGTTAFTSVFTNQTPTITLSGLSAGATTLSTAQMPSHTHAYYAWTSGYSAKPSGGGSDAVGWSGNTGAQGGGGSHTHSVSGSASSTAVTLNVQYVDLIIAAKD